MAMKPIFATCVMLFAPAVRAAEQCPPLTIAGSVPMQVGVDGRIYVSATVNGTPVSMLIDTGGFFTELSQAVVTALNLSTFHTGFRMVGLAGDTTNVATRASFTLGTMRSDRMDFMVMTPRHHLAPDVADAGGILAPNLFRNYDLDLDMAGRRLQLISQDHCDGKVVYWKSNALAEVPVRVTDVGHVLVPVRLDGRDLTALLDTGATVSLLNAAAAESGFGLDRPRGRARVFTHDFRSLSFAGVTVSNPRLALVPDLIRRNMGTPLRGTESHMPDVLLGMDILQRLHLYVAYKEQKLYITPAAAPPPAAAPSLPARVPDRAG
jgi:predicted aspartyl protease